MVRKEIGTLWPCLISPYLQDMAMIGKAIPNNQSITVVRKTAHHISRVLRSQSSSHIEWWGSRPHAVDAWVHVFGDQHLEAAPAVLENCVRSLVLRWKFVGSKHMVGLPVPKKLNFCQTSGARRFFFLKGFVNWKLCSSRNGTWFAQESNSGQGVDLCFSGVNQESCWDKTFE